ncbi:unnamed protein product, partial [Ectocarpus sp. 12 AP-2014]
GGYRCKYKLRTTFDGHSCLVFHTFHVFTCSLRSIHPWTVRTKSRGVDAWAIFTKGTDRNSHDTHMLGRRTQLSHIDKMNEQTLTRQVRTLPPYVAYRSNHEAKKRREPVYCSLLRLLVYIQLTPRRSSWVR